MSFPRQRALAHARLAEHEHGRRAPAPRPLERVAEDAKLSLSPDQARRVRRRDRPPRLGRGGGREAPQDLVTLRPSGWIDAQEIHAERVEIGGHRGAEGARRRGLVVELGGEDLERRAPVRDVARERLVEHHPERVPVRLRADGPRRRLLRGHVRDRSTDRLLGGAELDARVRHEAEVEEHDAPRRRHHHVRRLDVAVDLADRVQRVERARELRERRAEARLVVGRREPRGGGGGGGGVRGEARVQRGAIERRSGHRLRARGRARLPAHVGDEVRPLHELPSRRTSARAPRTARRSGPSWGGGGPRARGTRP